MGKNVSVARRATLTLACTMGPRKVGETAFHFISGSFSHSRLEYIAAKNGNKKCGKVRESGRMCEDSGDANGRREPRD